MSGKLYKSQGNMINMEESPMICEPSVKKSSNCWNPNVPFHGTQDEWLEHFHQIEQGNFMTMEEADKKFELWKNELLASRM